MMESIAKVFIVGGSYKIVRYDHETTVERVLHVVLEGIGVAPVAFSHFGLRLFSGPSPHTSGSVVWLHPLITLVQAQHMAETHVSSDDVTLELRLRFMPQSAYELLLTTPKAFFFLHDQVFDDFLKQVAWKVSLREALELAALKVCREADKNAKSCIDGGLDVNGAYIESVLQSFVPNTILANPAVKHSALKKQFVSLIKKFSHLPGTDSVLRSLALLVNIVKFDVEIFKASVGVGWISPVDLVVGPQVGISYRINERCEVSRLAELRSVLEITTRRFEPHSEKFIVQMKLSGNAQPLMVTVANETIADSLAHLIDGYQMMYNQGESVLQLKGFERCDNANLLKSIARKERRDIGLEHHVRIQRELVTLKELIGGGQFGNVYKGVYNDPKGSPMSVAVKVCKLESEPADTQLMLQEAQLMKQFEHENIITLVGVCVNNPMWLVMELAPLGELRQYLQSHRSSLKLTHLMQYSLQVARAVQYLHSIGFVHRDIAVRNVLVCDELLVKLTDFGLSRALQQDAIYTASRGKLPIKWLAPESINYREFSRASDVWMFAVCVWEIFSWGVKPWSGVANADVITQIETGNRPPCPDDCPLALYCYLEENLWAMEPQRRTTMAEVVKTMESLNMQLANRVNPEELTTSRKISNVPVILTNIEALPNLFILRTIEEQRRQAEEDEKWLDEQNDSIERREEEEEDEEDEWNSNGSLPDNIGRLSIRGQSQEEEMKSTLRQVRSSTAAIAEAVSHLHNAFNNKMRHEEFVSSVRNVTSLLKQLFVYSTPFIEQLSSEARLEVEKREALISNDMKQMSETMRSIVDSTSDTLYHSQRNELVRIARDLANNCDSFYRLLKSSNTSYTSKASPFRAFLTNC